MENLIKEFKAFAIRGNVVDLAIAVIIGTAFGKIVSSLVDNLVMPFLSLFLGGANFSGLSFTVGTLVIQYGTLLQSVIDFVIIAFVIFLIIKMINRLIRHEEKKVEEMPTPLSEEVRLLTEIRDALKK